MMADSGDKVRIITKDETVEGILMPNEETDSIIIKLDSGYNIGIEKDKIKKIDVIQKRKAAKTKKEKVKINKNLPTISILHTGGTIASKVNYETGGVIAQFSAEDLIGMFPEMAKIANIETELVANMMSEDIMFKHYQMIAKSIQKHISKGVKGIIIGHGTDTLAITAAALSFIFENLPIPIILVGAQRSSDRGSSDAGMNLICAAEFIAKTNFTGVAICMHENMDDDSCLILPATKTRKLHTSRRDAFKAVNDEPIARIDYKTKKIEFLKEYPKKTNTQLIVKDKFEEKVAIVKTYPNMFPDLFDSLTKNKYKGMILESTGIGQAPTNIPENIPNYEALKRFIKEGGVVILTSQCIFGRVHADIYTNCRRLKDIGIIFGEDMLTETAFIKLAWLLGNYKDKEEIKKLTTTDLRGEINERILTDEFLE
ncbi:MAG: Glu-tRNA(Gln) amidotransferase subunit GatD [Nanoarchaeota archaeon]